MSKVSSIGGLIIRLESLRSKFVEALKGRVISVSDLLTEIQGSGVLLNELKIISIHLVWLMQTEMQKLIFELTLISFYGALKESNISLLQESFASIKLFTLEKFVSVI
jgi:hypothetical protein